VPNNYLLIGSDAQDVNNCLVSAYEICIRRLARNVWPLYRGTRNRNSIQPTDQCIIYLAGKSNFAQTIVAFAEVGKIRTPRKDEELFDGADVMTGLPASVIGFSNLDVLPIPIRMHSLLDFLDFTPTNPAKWGSAMQGGCRRITQHDFEIILNAKQSETSKLAGAERAMRR